jgi:ABC-type bacteriocin/lantibiotic exporter with double-glycine peptidase domain
MIINEFNIVKQKRSNTCGYASAGMILSYLEGQSIDEDYLLEKEPFDAYGITFLKLMEVYKKYLKKYKAEIVYGDVEKMVEVIKNSLCLQIPMHIQYLTSNLMGDRKPILHYAALIGYDDAEETFVIADPYGSIKTLNKEDFFDSISFRNECLPEIIKQKYPSNMMIRFTLG